MSIISDRLTVQFQALWDQALANDGVASDAEVNAIASAIATIVGSDPRDSTTAMTALLANQEARLANVTTQLALAPPASRGAGLRRALESERSVRTFNRDQAAALRSRVMVEANATITDLATRMGNLREINSHGWSMFALEATDAERILTILEQTPAHRCPALALAIANDRDGLGSDLSWRIDGAQHDRLAAFMRKWLPNE